MIFVIFINHSLFIMVNSSHMMVKSFIILDSSFIMVNLVTIPAIKNQFFMINFEFQIKNHHYQFFMLFINANHLINPN